MKKYLFLAVLSVLCTACPSNPEAEWEYKDPFANPERDRFIERVMKDPQTLDEDLSDRAEATDVQIHESADGQLRVYSWISGGGTSPEWTNIFQYRDEYGKVHTDCSLPVMGEGPGSFTVTDIIDAGALDGKKTYFFDFYSKASSTDGYNDVYVVTVHKDTFELGPPFMRDGEMEESIGINYNIPSWYFRTNREGWDWLYHYQPDSKRLYAITVSETGELTHRYDVYEYDGRSFCYKGESGSPLLHESLSDYDCLINLYETEEHLVRVDQLPGGTYRLALWNDPSFSKQAQEPDMVVTGGVYDEGSGSYVFAFGDVMAYRYTDNGDYGEVLDLECEGAVLYRGYNRLRQAYLNSWVKHHAIPEETEETPSDMVKCLYRTDHYAVRVDTLRDGGYRYSSWNMKDYPELDPQPAIQLDGGHRKTIEDEEYYVFKNGNYTYKVPVDYFNYMEVTRGKDRICKERIMFSFEISDL